MFEDNDTVIVKGGSSFSFSLTTLGFITFIVFLILKVTGAWPEIDWFWVWFPLWIPWALVLGIFILFIPIIIITAIVNN